MKALTTILTWMTTLGCFALPLILATTAEAQSTINDCEKIQAADAYNQCLAKFGPPAKSGNLEPERPGDIKAGPAEAAAGGGKPSRVKRAAVAGRRHRGRGAHVARVRHGGGRKRMTIPVGK